MGLAQRLLAQCLEHQELQNELYCQLIKQTSRHPSQPKTAVQVGGKTETNDHHSPSEHRCNCERNNDGAAADDDEQVVLSADQADLSLSIAAVQAGGKTKSKYCYSHLEHMCNCHNDGCDYLDNDWAVLSADQVDLSPSLTAKDSHPGG